MSKNVNLRETVEYKEHGFKIVTCPVCGKETLDSHFICPHCEWEYDGTTHELEISSANGYVCPKDYRELHGS